jgi:hypothetical protein
MQSQASKAICKTVINILSNKHKYSLYESYLLVQSIINITAQVIEFNYYY